MTDCLFCKIVGGDIPADVVLDGPTVLAFRDVNPQAPVHVLVIPKEHVEDVRAVGPEHGGVLVDMIAAANQVGGETPGGYRLVFNVGPDAGQTVFHLHMHVLGGRGMGWPPG
jgi:histidine triad (HIT) family protein